MPEEIYTNILQEDEILVRLVDVKEDCPFCLLNPDLPMRFDFANFCSTKFNVDLMFVNKISFTD